MCANEENGDITVESEAFNPKNIRKGKKDEKVSATDQQ